MNISKHLARLGLATVLIGAAIAPVFAANTTVVVEPSDMATSLPDVIARPQSWFFYNDESDQIDNTLGSFVVGPALPPTGSDSVQISVSGTQRRNLATYQFSGTPLAAITTLAFSTYNPSLGNGGSSNRSGYLNFNVDFNGSDTWQKRLVYVPSQNGTVVQDSWQEWDALNGGNAMWVYSGATWPATVVGPDANLTESGDTMRSWSDILADYPNIRIRVTDSWLGVRVGEPYADGYTENIDAFKFGTENGMTTFDFDLVEEVIPSTSTVTMCKKDTAQVAQPGWTLMLKGDAVQEDLSVPTNVSSGINSSSLDSGTSYIAQASGTWQNQGGANPADAEYTTTDNWATHMDGYTGYSTDILELQINSSFDPNSNWGAYNAMHTYARSFIPAVTGPANFRIFDGTGTTQEAGWFGDNIGSLSVDLYKGYAGVTGADGCMTFSNVPYGTYTADEVAQPNWSNTSGLGSVVVDSPFETFTVANSYTPPQYVVHLFKYINGEQATIANAGGVNFPMFTSTYNAPFTLGPAGWTTGDIAYEASTSPMPMGSSYSAEETLTTSLVGASCDGSHTYALEGYGVGETLPAAIAAGISLSIPNFTNLQSDKYIVVRNTKCPTAGSISGMKYNDKNRNGKKDAGEVGLAGWVIKLKLGNTIVTTTTAADGTYSFANLAPGTYKVRETHQKGWKRMSKNPKPIVISAGSIVTGVNFGNAQKHKEEKEDTDRDDDRDDESGWYHAGRGPSNYDKDKESKDHDRRDNDARR